MKKKTKPCPFCEKVEASSFIQKNKYAAAMFDGFPISEGHVLIVPLRHEADFLSLTKKEHSAIMDLVRIVSAGLKIYYGACAEYKSIDGFNIGVNIGEAAGQTVGHAHLHLIPRRKGDVKDPRGGVRWIIPGKAKYWKD